MLAIATKFAEPEPVSRADKDRVDPRLGLHDTVARHVRRASKAFRQECAKLTLAHLA
jgi:hypothetical protein